MVGRARAKQARCGLPGGAKKILPILLHGDAAFAGQGVWAETLNLADVAAYSVGGTIHVIVNNLLGFTTEPRDYQSARFASSLAKRQDVPGSKFAFLFDGKQQARYLSIEPKRMEVIDRIEFVQGGDMTAPVIMALTLELRE